MIEIRQSRRQTRAFFRQRAGRFGRRQSGFASIRVPLGDRAESRPFFAQDLRILRRHGRLRRTYSGKKGFFFSQRPLRLLQARFKRAAISAQLFGMFQGASVRRGGAEAFRVGQATFLGAALQRLAGLAQRVFTTGQIGGGFFIGAAGADQVFDFLRLREQRLVNDGVRAFHPRRLKRLRRPRRRFGALLLRLQNLGQLLRPIGRQRGEIVEGGKIRTQTREILHDRRGLEQAGQPLLFGLGEFAAVFDVANLFARAGDFGFQGFEGRLMQCRRAFLLAGGLETVEGLIKTAMAGLVVAENLSRLRVKFLFQIDQAAQP